MSAWSLLHIDKHVMVLTLHYTLWSHAQFIECHVFATSKEANNVLVPD